MALLTYYHTALKGSADVKEPEAHTHTHTHSLKSLFMPIHAMRVLRTMYACVNFRLKLIKKRKRVPTTGIISVPEHAGEEVPRKGAAVSCVLFHDAACTAVHALCMLTCLLYRIRLKL